MVADSVNDYSDRQGKAGWSYGWDQFRHPRLSQEMVPVADPWRRNWSQPRYPWLAIDPHDAHPSRSEGRLIWASRRWTSSASGPVRISRRIIRSEPQNDGVFAHIAVDGRLIFSANMGGASSTKEIEYDVKANLRSGSKVDFIVTPGPHDDIDFDRTRFEARIIKDEP